MKTNTELVKPVEESRTDKRTETRRKLALKKLQEICDEQDEDPEKVLRSIETYCELILNTLHN